MFILQHVAHRRSPREVVTDWWRKWQSRTAYSSAVNAGVDGDRMGQDVGLPSHELQRLASRGCHAADLMLCRMVALNLDPREVGEVDRATLLDLERVCSNCDCKARCRRDLARRPDNAVWEDYCPNVATLKMLNAMPWASRREW